ncbi:MAG: alpha/beta hydrolase [Pseudonocardia sp.]
MDLRDPALCGPGDEPMVASWGTTHPSAPLVVLLHGNGTSEHSLIEISPWLPHGPVAYASLRGPIQHGKGFRWWREGPPDPDDLAATCRWVLSWLDGMGDPERPVLLLAFRDGVTLAGALMAAAPERFSGAILLYGALPDPPPRQRGHLSGIPVFLAHATEDPRTPADRLDRTWTWLARESGAPLWAERVPGGAQLAGSVVGGVGTWLADRLDFLRAHGENPLPDGDEPRWPSLRGPLPRRSGPAPECSTRIPQQQLDQYGPQSLHDAVWERLVALDGVLTKPARIGPAGTRSLLLDRAATSGPDEAFLLAEDGEFAHQHPAPDASLHVVLPDAHVYDAIVKGWAVPHPLAGLRLPRGTVLVPGPRDAAELDVVAGIAAAAHAFATAG